MSITASELFAIVEGVPREAWPVWEDSDTGSRFKASFEHEQWNVKSQIGQSVSALHPQHAAIMFTGSMVAWLAWLAGPADGDRTVSVISQGGFNVVVADDDGTVVSEAGPTILEALAAACREQKQ